MEKYGTIPPRFTKAWWAYFWEYYKWHTLASTFVIVLIAVTAVQCATKTRYDLSVMYAGDAVFSEETTDKLSAAISEVIDDSDGNGERNVSLSQLSFGAQNSDPQYEMAMQTKLMLEFSAGESYIFIFSKGQLDTYLNQEHVDDLFVPVDEWIDNPQDIDGVATGKKNGVSYAVNLGESAYLKELGLNMQDQYIVLRAQRDKELSDEKLGVQYQNAVKACNYLIAR